MSAITQPTQSVVAAETSRNPWIVSRKTDLLLFIGTPWLILPVTWAILQGVTISVFTTVVMALGAQGHHLPGILRAYGDRHLFERFRWRFIFAPVIFVTLSAACFYAGVSALEMPTFVWAIWHAAMQTFGFARIYHGKAALPTSSTAARVEKLLCVSWFGAVLLLSPLRLHYLLYLANRSGIPLPTHGALDAARTCVALGLVALTALFAWHTVHAWRRGHGFSGPKLLVLVSSIGFWWGINLLVQHPLLGLPLFEIFHDIQYTGLIWFFNRRRAADAAPLWRPLRWLAQRGVLGVLLYIALICAYGALRNPWSTSQTLGQLALHFFIMSQLLHFYFDGFIWKMQQPDLRAGLALDAPFTPPLQPAHSGRALQHGLAVLAFAVLIAALAWGELRTHVDPDDEARRLTQLVPDSPWAWFQKGEMDALAGRWSAGVDAYSQALTLYPGYDEARDRFERASVHLADDLLQHAEGAAALQVMRRAAQHQPTLAAEMNDEAVKLQHSDNPEALPSAERLYRLAALADEHFAMAHFNLATLLANQAKFGEAIAEAQAGLTLAPTDADAQGLLQDLYEASTAHNASRLAD